MGQVGEWYFAYGSMVNPVSLRRRGIIPEESIPGILHGYSLGFQLEVEVAAYQPYVDTTSSHSNTSRNSRGAVVSLAEDAASNCVVTIGSEHSRSSSGDSTPPSSLGKSASSIAAKAFIVPQERLLALQQEHPEWHNSLPTERYITIITKGLRHFGADPSWIQGVAATPFTPNKKPEQYERIPLPADPASLRTFTSQELAAFRDKIVDGKAISALGSKVMEVDLSGRENGPYANIVKTHMTGHDHTYNLCMNLYDPGLPELHSPKDLTGELRADDNLGLRLEGNVTSGVVTLTLKGR
eukprot:gene8447-8631_t